MRFLGCLAPDKGNLAPSIEGFRRVMNSGWIGQDKMLGMRLQLHVDAKSQITNFTKKGTLHTRILSDELDEATKTLTPKQGTNVYDCEWVQPLNQIFLFDLLAFEDDILKHLTYPERYKMLTERIEVTGPLSILGIMTSPEECLNRIMTSDHYVEGLVFKSNTTKGWSSKHSMIRCRKKA